MQKYEVRIRDKETGKVYVNKDGTSEVCDGCCFDELSACNTASDSPLNKICSELDCIWEEEFEKSSNYFTDPNTGEVYKGADDALDPCHGCVYFKNRICVSPVPTNCYELGVMWIKEKKKRRINK